MTTWTCPSCKNTISSAFCAACGEQLRDPRDLTWRGLAALTFQAFSPVDGKVLRSFRVLLTLPGRLTSAFQDGLRKPYIGPFQIFLLANVLFFALQSMSAFNIFTQPLDYRLHGQPLSDFGQYLLDARLRESGRSFAAYAPVFDQAVTVNAKSFIGLMVPPFALLLPLVFWRPSRPFAVHFVFSLHFYAVLLLLFCVPLGVMAVEKWLGGDGLMSQGADYAVSIGLVIACAVYLYAAIPPVYGTRGAVRLLQAAVLTLAVVLIFMGYRFALLPITLYTT